MEKQIQEFEKWCEKLLDTGKRNRLISFKESLVKTMEILAPDIEEVFTKIVDGHTLSFFDVDAYTRTIKNNVIVEEQARFSKREVKDVFSTKLKKSEILSYKKEVCNERILKNLKKTVDNSLIEKGINILYLAFGFLKWSEVNDPSTIYSSPLILIPLKLNKEINKAYTIKEYDDEIDTNPTLTYKFKNEFDISLPQYQEEGFEDETLRKYFQRVSEVVSDRNWKVTEEMQIGTFSFLKINMYKDLKENKEKILQNENICKMLNKESTPLSQIEENSDNHNNNNNINYDNLEFVLHNVVDADSSQMEAIYRAKNGESLVLQGPPGTGKSQTITNLIAEFLYDGKKVLFVSEKLAALKVVYNNLSKTGLSDYCLELHSNKTNKKDVINELYRVLMNDKKVVSPNVDTHLNNLLHAKKQLDQYTDELHTLIPELNETPYQVLGKITKYKNYPSFDFAIKDIKSKDFEYLSKVLTLIETYKGLNEFVGYDYRLNPFYGNNKSTYSYEEKLNFKELLNSLKKDFDLLCSSLNKVLNLMKMEVTSFKDLKEVTPAFKVLAKMKYFESNFFNLNKLYDINKNLTKYVKDVESYLKAEEITLSVFKNDIFMVDLDDFYTRYYNEYSSFLRIFKSNYRRDQKFLKNFLKDPSRKIKYNEMLNILQAGSTLKKLKQDIDEDKRLIFINISPESIENYTFNLEKDYKEIQLEVEELSKVLTDKFSPLKDISKSTFEGEIQVNLKSFLKTYESLKNLDSKVTKLQSDFDTSIINFETISFTSLINKLDSCISNFTNLENYSRFVTTLDKMKELDLESFIVSSIENQIPVETLNYTYQSVFYTNWIYQVFSEREALYNFSRLNQDKQVDIFKEKDKLKFEISKAEIISALDSKIPNPNYAVNGSQVKVLIREANKVKRLRPVRILLHDIGELVQKLKPCFLMSPLSVSTYLDSDSTKFDVVVFDEASQIFPWDAIGAIYRAKQVIVVGDSKQMPPSNFFNNTLTEEDETEDEDSFDEDTLDFESILDLSTAIFGQTRLSWHYRSKTEELIAFSNNSFYDGKLVTFPSAIKENKDMGIDFYYVEDGVFNRRTRNNLVEAQEVVKLVFEQFKKHPERSLGVVAFSISQQKLIDNLIDEARDNNPEYAPFFDSDLREPFFVKNLETVQGDERDTIIFSVGYAEDKDGKFIHNFGPLNKKGGERRLNVAVTRAKYNVILVSSIKSTHIDLEKTQAAGSILLKNYLDIAEHGLNHEEDGGNSNSSNNNQVNSNEVETSFESQVYEFIKKSGYRVDFNVGCSQYKIDIGVKHPYKDDYVIAIECDGDTYKNSKTTRDRDRLREEILNKYGWNYYRIWSTDYFRNPETEKMKLLEAIKEAISNYDKKEEKLSNSLNISNPENQNVKENNNKKVSSIKNDTFLIEEENTPKDLKSYFGEYEHFDFQPMNKYLSFDSAIGPLVAKEGPICEELLIKKMMLYFRATKITKTVREIFARKMRSQRGIKKIDNFYISDVTKQIQLRLPKEGEEPRDILLIPDVELASGMVTVIKQSVGISKSGLFKTIANLLGFSRVTSKVSDKLDKVLSSLIASGRITEEEDQYFIED